MSVDPINATLELTYEKIDQLLRSRTKIDKEIIDWTILRDSLLAVLAADAESESDPSDVEISTLSEPSGRATIGFTDGIRMVLRQNANREIPISVPEVREQLINLGFKFEKYAQPLVPIHNTLKRLGDQGEVEAIKSDGQTVGYRWISSVERALSEDASYLEAIGGPITTLTHGTSVHFDRKRAMEAVKKFKAIREEKKKGK
jgi:hypothetical protein